MREVGRRGQASGGGGEKKNEARDQKSTDWCKLKSFMSFELNPFRYFPPDKGLFY